jgi:hypothetical protein
VGARQADFGEGALTQSVQQRGERHDPGPLFASVGSAGSRAPGDSTILAAINAPTGRDGSVIIRAWLRREGRATVKAVTVRTSRAAAHQKKPARTAGGEALQDVTHAEQRYPRAASRVRSKTVPASSGS